MMQVMLAVVHGGPVVDAHQGFARVVLIYSLAVALWGLFLYVRGSNPSGGYLGALAINEGVAVLQAAIGLALVILGHRPPDVLHYLYGVVSVVTLPSAYFYSSGGTERKDSLIFGLAALFLAAISIRASMTG
jgi:hypothetical protein